MKELDFTLESGEDIEFSMFSEPSMGFDLSESPVEIGGGGTDVYTITITETASGGETVISADKTVAEIVAAVEAGKQIVMTGDIVGGGTAIPTAQTFLFAGYPTIILSYKSYISDPFEAFYMALSVDGADEWGVERTVISELPATSSLLKGDGEGGAVAAVAGVDYQAPISAGTGISIVNGVISCTFADGNGVSY